MSKAIVLVSLILMSISASQSQLVLYKNLQQTTQPTLEVQIKYYFSASRGFIQGFSRGFYNKLDYLISDQCLNSNAYALFDDLYMSFMTGSFLNPLKTFSNLYQLNFMVEKSCDLDEITYDLSTFCEVASCDMSKVMTNVQNNVFKFIGTINSLAEVFTNEVPDWTDLTAGFNKYDVIGGAVGSTLRIMFNYH